MSTISHQPTGVRPEQERASVQLFTAELWGSLAIAVMWIAVAVAAVWAPDFVSSTTGGSTTTIPSGIAVAVFASVGTWAVAKYGFGHRPAE